MTQQKLQLTIISDTVCPWCFVGKRRLEQAIAERPEIDFEIDWQPFQLNPDMPREGADRRQYYETKFGSAEKAREVYDAVTAEGARVGIEFALDRITRTPNTVDSHRLIKWAKSAGVQDEVVEALFRRYFLEGKDIGDTDVLMEVATEVGLDDATMRTMLASDNDVEVVKQEDSEARRMGVTGVPCFIVEGQYVVFGAQPKEAFLQLFDQLAATGSAAPDSPETSF